MESMRDTFFNELFALAKQDSSIMVLTSDFSAPSFDRYRTELPHQFVNTGISEQNTILVASGLALSGMKVYIVSIAPFITKRCYEQISLYPADMNLNITIVGVGAGFSYSEAGATHHSIEDLGLMQMLPNMRILSASDNALVKHFVKTIHETGGPFYVRLDRRSLPDIYDAQTTFPKALIPISDIKEINIIATGYMTHTAINIQKELAKQNIAIGIVDAFSLPLDAQEFKELFAHSSQLITIEEHVPAGGLGEAVNRMINNVELPLKVKSYALDLSKSLCHTYGTRDELHQRHGISEKEIIEFVKTKKTK